MAALLFVPKKMGLEGWRRHFWFRVCYWGLFLFYFKLSNKGNLNQKFKHFDPFAFLRRKQNRILPEIKLNPRTHSIKRVYGPNQSGTIVCARPPIDLRRLTWLPLLSRASQEWRQVLGFTLWSAFMMKCGLVLDRTAATAASTPPTSSFTSGSVFFWPPD